MTAQDVTDGVRVYIAGNPPFVGKVQLNKNPITKGSHEDCMG